MRATGCSGRNNREAPPENSPLKAELKRKGVTCAQLVERLAGIGISEKEVNVANKLSQGKCSAALMLACLKAVGSQNLHLAD
ncbi:DUF6471 domain-containing protein [Marivita sp.]|uniref:DUF6471 domain-containing protein n=1 Tax=Marivita sp. TaxID=2003365 RepID=UPI002605335B|nr:DUF6471 domain-containing protein [Marivita sp.]